MGEKPDGTTTYMINYAREDNREPTVVTRLHQELDQCLEESKKKLNGASRKADRLRRALRKADSYPKLDAALSSRPPPPPEAVQRAKEAIRQLHDGHEDHEEAGGDLEDRRRPPVPDAAEDGDPLSGLDGL